MTGAWQIRKRIGTAGALLLVHDYMYTFYITLSITGVDGLSGQGKLENFPHR